MIRIIFLSFILNQLILPQEFHSPESRKLFADFLFCSNDYLRAIIEYEEYLKHFNNDTVIFKIALGYSEIEDYNAAIEKFSLIPEKSGFYFKSRNEYLKSSLLINDFQRILFFQDEIISPNELKLINFAYLLDGKLLPVKEKFLSVFPDDEQKIMEEFYDAKFKPIYRSPFKAGILSAIIPGTGKIYTGQISDGITSFLLNGLLAFISYNNFRNDHRFRGWVFAGIGAFFYAGNIYGSVVSANIYNTKADYEYKSRVKQYLESKNYYIEKYDFCN